MAFKFQGNLDGIYEVHFQFISNVLKRNGFKNEVVDVQPVGKAGDNYGSNVKRITVVTGGEPFKMVAKFAPQLEIARVSNNVPGLFKNEHVMYMEFLPKLVELQKAAGVPKEERFRYPICYGTYMEEPYELILLEDLQVSNFIMLDRLKPLTDVTVRLILKDFALLHSLSFVLKTKEPETFKEIKDKLLNFWYYTNKHQDNTAYFRQLQNDIISMLRSEKQKRAIDGLLEQIGSIAMKLHQIDVDGKYSVIQQGDSWTNNFMFRMEDGIPIENIMIDYQLSNESNPVCDLLYMIFNCTDYATRSKHYLDWIDYYHAEFDQSLYQFGMKANMVYPRNQLDVDLRRYSKFYMILAIATATVHLRSSEDAAKIKEVLETELSVEERIQSLSVTRLDATTLAKFMKKTEGLIDSMFDYGYL